MASGHRQKIQGDEKMKIKARDQLFEILENYDRELTKLCEEEQMTDEITKNLLESIWRGLISKVTEGMVEIKTICNTELEKRKMREGNGEEEVR